MTLVLEIVLIAAAAVGVAVCLALLPDAESSRWRRPAAPTPSRPEPLARLEGLVVMSGTSALQVHAYLRPLLAEIASRRLAARGQTLAGMSEATGRRLLGDHLWDIVRPDRPFPEERHGPGVSSQELSAMLDVLERL
jgi:hypothetical protein